MKKAVASARREALNVDFASVVGLDNPRLEWRQALKKDVLKMGLLSEDMLG